MIQKKRKMSKGSSTKESKRVNWVPDANLCQVKLFVSEDCPSKVGNKTEDHLLAETSGLLQSDGLVVNKSAPVIGDKAFSETSKQTCVPQIEWRCPPMFILNNDWHVGAGEFSEEVRTPNYRRMSAIEAVYPCPSAIPPSSSVSPGLEEYDCDDSGIPVIPLIPIEELHEVGLQPPPCPIPVSSRSVVMNQDKVAVRFAPHINKPEKSNVIGNEKSVGISTGLDADVVAMFSAAFTAVKESSEKGIPIDNDLFIKILSDPEMVARLSKDSGLNGATKVSPISELKPTTSSVTSPTKDCHHTIFQKPSDESLNVHGVSQHSTKFGSSKATHVPTLPLSNVKPLLTLSPGQADENSNQFYEGLESSSRTSLSVSTSITPSKVQDMIKLPQPIISTPTALSQSVLKTAMPSTFRASLPDKIHSKSPVDGLEFPISSAHNLGSNSASGLSSQPDKGLLQNFTNLDPQYSQSSFLITTSALMPTYQASISNQVPPMAVSPRPGFLFESNKPNMVLLAEKQNQILPQEIQRVRNFSQYPSPSDGLGVSLSSSVQTPVVKDMNYYKSLIKLHGSQEQHTDKYMGAPKLTALSEHYHKSLINLYGSQAEHTDLYRSRALEQTTLSGQGHSREKIQKPCKFFSSAGGCRNGLSCRFQHDPLLNLGAGSAPDTHSSKRSKLSL